MRRVQGVFDEFDYEAIIEKLREHKVEAVKHGRVLVNRPPYGYRVVVARNERGKRIGSYLEVVDEEAAVVRQIFDWYVFGDDCGEPLSITAISDRLSSQLIPSGGDRRGLRSRKRKLPGSAWHESHINKILRSETYIGRWYYGRTKSVPVPGSDRSKQVEVPREHWLCVPCPAIVDEELFKAASNRAATNTAQAKR